MLVLCVLGLLAEGWWVEKRVFFVFYEPHITPMSYWGTRLESVAYTPVAMALGWWEWITLPMVAGAVLSVVMLRKSKSRGLRA